MASELDGKRVAFVATDMVEQVELTEPWKAVEQAGGTPELLSITEGEIQGFNHFDKADAFPVDRQGADANADEDHAPVLPGGVGNPDQLRAVPEVQQFVRSFFEQGKPVAVICHGPWTMIDAGVVQGRPV